MSAVKRLKPVNTVHPAIRRFYKEKELEKKKWEAWLSEHARRTALIQNALVLGQITEQEAVKAYGEYVSVLEK